MASEQKFSNEAVEKATGETWAHWFKVLDAWRQTEGAEFKKDPTKLELAQGRGIPKWWVKGHKAAAEYLWQEHKVSGWWAQSITVRYEWERGLRKRVKPLG